MARAKHFNKNIIKLKYAMIIDIESRDTARYPCLRVREASPTS